MLQQVLGQIGSLALRAYQQKRFVLAESIHLSMNPCQIHIRGSVNGRRRRCVDDPVSLCLAFREFCRSKTFQPSVHLVHQHVYRMCKRMNRGGEWRRIRKVHICQVIHLRLQRDCRHTDIYDFIHFSFSERLHAQKPSGFFISDQFDNKVSCSRHIMRLVVHYRQYGDHVVPCILRLGF